LVGGYLKSYIRFHSFFVLFVGALANQLVAAEAPLKLSATIDLTEIHALKKDKPTFFSLMTAKKTGIKSKMDADYPETFTVVSAKTFRAKASNFSHVAKLERNIVDRARGLDKAVSLIAGSRLTVDKMYGKLFGVMKEEELFEEDAFTPPSRLVGAIVPLVGLASGKGVLVQLDAETYVYNYGYAQGSGGEDLEADVVNRRTGRSYGASIERNAYDPTDRDYLTELSNYVHGANTKELRNFYTTVFSILLKSDTSGIKRLKPAGQTVIADYMAIYMAELARHLMTGLKRYEWENALTEITMLAAYSVKDDGMTLDPRGGAENDKGREMVTSSEIEVEKRLLGYFGVGTDGSGLDGANKRRRHNLSNRVVKAMRGIDENKVTEVEGLIEARAGRDIYDDVMEHVNSFKTQKSVATNADALIRALVDFVMSTGENAAGISETFN